MTEKTVRSPLINLDPCDISSIFVFPQVGGVAVGWGGGGGVESGRVGGGGSSTFNF
jgi:hypothetical protein